MASDLSTASSGHHLHHLLLPLVHTFLLPSSHPSPTADLPKKGQNSDIGQRSTMAAMRRSVKDLNFGGWEEKEAAVVEITSIIRDQGIGVKKMLVEFGIVPTLVEMLDCVDERRWGLAAHALAELAEGSHSIKTLMVEAGLLSRLEKLLPTTTSAATKTHLLSLLHSLSSLSTTPFHIAPSLPSLLPTLTTTTPSPTTLSILSNLSSDLHNARAMVTSGLVPILLSLSSKKPTSMPALLTLSNLVVTQTGKKAIEDDPSFPSCFLEVLKWGDAPKCQELASYIMLVVVVRGGREEHRRKVVDEGGVPVLLEVALLGSPLAQRRVLEVVEWVKGKEGLVQSGPQGGGSCGGDGNEKGRKGHRGEMRRMVRQSLDRNMDSIMRRARRGGGSSDGGSAVLTGCSRSKSFPF